MELLVYIIVLIFEILYYTLFMKFARKDGKFWKYLVLFIVINFFFLFVGTNAFISYIALILMILLGIKYFVKVKVSLYDMLIIFVMLLFKLLIEMMIGLPMSCFISNIDVCKILLGIIKVIIMLCIENKISNFYKKFKISWDKNKFFIRYIFSIFMFIYVISACLFIIFVR